MSCDSKPKAETRACYGDEAARQRSEGRTVKYHRLHWMLQWGLVTWYHEAGRLLTRHCRIQEMSSVLGVFLKYKDDRESLFKMAEGQPKRRGQKRFTV